MILYRQVKMNINFSANTEIKISTKELDDLKKMDPKSLMDILRNTSFEHLKQLYTSIDQSTYSWKENVIRLGLSGNRQRIQNVKEAIIQANFKYVGVLNRQINFLKKNTNYISIVSQLPSFKIYALEHNKFLEGTLENELRLMVGGYLINLINRTFVEAKNPVNPDEIQFINYLKPLYINGLAS